MTRIKQLTAAILCFMLMAPIFAHAQQVPQEGWQLQDPSEGIYGVGATKAYQLLKGRSAKKVIVAILDSGVDIDHEDLKDNIWVNPNEIPGNGIDDDNNGYIDDIHGWNFLGNADGVNLDEANLEITRIYRKLAPKFQDVESKKEVDKADRKAYELFVEAQEKILKELNAAANEFAQIDGFVTVYQTSDSAAKANLGEEYTAEDVLSWQPETEDLQLYQSILAGLAQDPNFSSQALERYHKYLREKLEFHYNPSFNDRAILGDDPDDFTERFYGNNNVAAPHNGHGTHVAGIVGAVTGNNIGIDGIARNVELMILRTVPNGDEFDKDVANSIRYAVDNGADIINMSFGKGYSPHIEEVQRAIKYAEENDVLLVHAAGNEAKNLDKVNNFPNPNYVFEKGTSDTYITVGASAANGGENLVGVFSNYGKKTVDIFSPGVRIYSTKPNNKYAFEDGTSMAAPVVSGVAALIKSYFPEITAKQLKELLIKSSNQYPKLKVLMPDPEYQQTKSTKFKKLSKTAGVVSASNAAKLAIELYSK